MENLKEILLELETELTDHEVRLSKDRLGELLADDFIEYGSAGKIYTKEITIASLTGGPSPVYKIYDFEVIPLSDEFAQTRFKTERINLDGTKLVSLRSSIWQKNGDKWQMFFHQGTPANAA